MARKRATLTDLLNDLTYRVIYDKFKLVATNMFEWSGLPDGIDERYIERLLFDEGRAIFFRDPAMSYMCLSATESSDLNVYGEPLRWRATGFNYNREYDADDCVIISNNKYRIATRDFVTMYASKLAEAHRTMDVNVKACKTPYILACDDKSLLTVKQIFSKIDGNEPAIFTDKAFDVESLAVLKTGVTFLCNELQEYARGVESELLTFLGKNNVNFEKRERVITDEVNANNDVIQSFAEIQLNAREDAARQINELYPELTVGVKLRGSETMEKPVGGVKNDIH